MKPNNMRSMISFCCLMLKLVSLFHHNPHVFQKALVCSQLMKKVRDIVYLIAVGAGFRFFNSDSV